MFELARASATPLVDQIVEQLAARIQDGRLIQGARLPSIRGLAQQLHASPYTVVDA